MQKRTLIFDIDGCVADVQTPFVKAVNKLGHPITYDEIKKHNLSGWLPLSDAEIWAIYKHIIETHAYNPIPGSMRFLQQFEESFDRVPLFCTARCETTREATRSWLRQCTDLNPYIIHQSLNFDKTAVAKLVGATHMIEDNDEAAIQLAEAGIKVGLFSQPWNEAIDTSEYDNITRINRWDEVMDWYLA
jgi:uncharacterized HAD superfamily protein